MKQSLFAFGPPVRTFVRRVRTGVALAVALGVSLTGVPAGAQEAGTIAGVVVGAGGQPVPSAQINVQGTSLGTATDASGLFRITGLTGAEATIEVRRIGYRMESRTVRVGDTNLRIALAEQSVVLDAVVVTGTTGAQSKRELGNSVTTINASQAKEIAAISSIQNLLNGRAPG
ncbi:MAG: carboxypeptidase-like regulatory domain-containing protein, partial [Gemmatimonadota bacterium]|nr:carboxypeptidase-like regulatory domain-containing protein [Gemmatimonadota bacterium]